jgi:AhpD family alkylhydroperoxidase
MTDTSTASETAVVPPMRLAAAKLAPAAYRAMSEFDKSVDLDPALRELVKLRASVINGCSYCVDLHTTDARAAGEDDRRLASVAAWRHAPFFTARERAALALTDALTRIADDGVSDEVWADAAAHFADVELANLVWAITTINSWNRFAIATLLTPRDLPG